MHGIHRTLLLGQVFHDRCCQSLILVLSSGPMLQWCWLWFCHGKNCCNYKSFGAGSLCRWMHNISKHWKPWHAVTLSYMGTCIWPYHHNLTYCSKLENGYGTRFAWLLKCFSFKKQQASYNMAHSHAIQLKWTWHFALSRIRYNYIYIMPSCPWYNYNLLFI